VKTLQRILCTVILLCTVIGALQAQGIDTTSIRINPPVLTPPSKTFLVEGMKDTLWLSDVPTVFELTKIFAAPGTGKLDPFLTLQAVVGKGDSAVSALDSLLFFDPIAEIITTRISPGVGAAGGAERELVRTDTVRPNKLYAVMALEAIGTKASYPVLFRLAQLHPNRDVRGISLNALAGTYHEGERLQRFVPDKQLVHLLLSNVDDTSSVPYLGKTFGQIAREGLIHWLGQDFGEPQGRAKRLQDAKGADIGSLADYREQWWSFVASKVVWNASSNTFQIKN
jgi:hypothetical protein